MKQLRLMLVGGFLGAGKTTMLRTTAERLVGQGLKVGLVTNDQAAHLVDTGILRGAGSAVAEVAGGCVCCRFEDFVGSLKELMRSIDPDVIVCEPVGSCTDISATVINPLKEIYGELFSIAPFSVLVEPKRIEQLCGAGSMKALPDSVLHILRTQLEEADMVLLNKVDTLSKDDLGRLRGLLERDLPGRPVLEVSALTGAGVDAWLNVVSRNLPAGQRLAEVDYEIYAAGEAVLGWLNATVRLTPTQEADWRELLFDLTEEMRLRSKAVGAEIAHLKILAGSSTGMISAHVTSTSGRAELRGGGAPAWGPATLTVNARVATDPERLRELVLNSLATVSENVGELEVLSIESFSPAPPKPTHRMSRLAGGAGAG